MELVAAEGEFRRGWRPLLAAALGVGLGTPALINTAGLFVVPMQEEFGWSRSAVSIGPMIGFIYALLMPVASLAIEHFGTRRIAIAGQMMLVAGILMLAVMPAHFAPFAGIVAYLCIVATLTGNVVYLRAVAGWFDRHAGKAFALALSGVSIIGAALQPLLAIIIREQGWRIGYVALAAAAALALPATLAWLRDADQPSPRSQPQRGRRSRFAPVLKDGRFWLIATTFGAAAIPIGGFVGHLHPMLLAGGFSVAAAASVVAAFLIFTALGRLVAGVLFDIAPPNMVAAAFLGLAGIGALVLASSGIEASGLILVLAMVALIGAAQGAEGDFIALFTLRIYGAESFALVFSLVITSVALCFAIGGMLFSAIYDYTGTYEWAATASGVILLAAAGLSILIPVRPAQSGP